MQTTKGSNKRNAVERQPIKDQPEVSRRATIDVLPDDVLVDVFNFYLDDPWHELDAWETLVHVCRRWRQVVFASPRRLNVQLLCTARRQVKKLLDIWPALPIIVYNTTWRKGGFTNIDAALEHNDRVCEITLCTVPSPLLERFASIKKPFPALTDLVFSPEDDDVPALPDSFLGGSAPQLHKLSLDAIPFPGLPKMLLSAHHLVRLYLLDIPDSGFIPSAAMATCLSSLTSLESLTLKFRSPQSHQDQTNRHLPPLTRTVLPTLNSFSFKGDSEYLEVIVARIDTPLLKILCITFFYQVIFDTPLLRSFISRTEAFNAFYRAEMLFCYNYVEVTLLKQGRVHNRALRLRILCSWLEEQLSSMAWACNLSLPPLATLERLKICEDIPGSYWQDDTEDSPLWPDVLQPFIMVKSLYIEKGLAPRVAPALQELSGESVTEVLPTLQDLFVEFLPSSGPVWEAIAQFIAARQLLGHPVTVHHWANEEWREN